jgi:adenylate cyclase
MRLIVALAAIAFGVSGAAQTRPSKALAQSKANAKLHSLVADPRRDAKETIAETDTLLGVFKAANALCDLAETNGIRSTSYSELGVYDSAMACAHRVFRVWTPGCDSAVLLRGYVALSRLYIGLGDNHAVDSICNTGLALWRNGWAATNLRNSLLTNKAIAAAHMGDMPGAAASFRLIRHYARVEGNEQDEQDANANLGVIKNMEGDLDSAEYFQREVLKNAKAHGDHSRIAKAYSNLGDIAGNRGTKRSTIALYDSAMAEARLANDLSLQVTLEGVLTGKFKDLGEMDQAYDHAVEWYYLNDSLLNSEKVKVLTEMQAKYEASQKAKQILELKAENLASELEKEQVKRTRNIYLFTSLGIVGLAIGLWSRLRFVDRSRRAIRKEKNISEGLLHNILPVEVANEIKAKGYADVKEFEVATVLFTDFKGFTAMSEKLSAKELVSEIDTCFKAFDGIVGKYGIEKIKTIGDSYMAVGGLPDALRGDPRATVLAALEMQAFMKGYKEKRKAEGRLYFEMRAGLHTGPVIAGIVGVKKYAYDIWSDTVNVASRMESSGAVGMVNISACTYEIVKDAPDLRFIARGAVEAKGKGPMAMYFVEQAEAMKEPRLQVV